MHKTLIVRRMSPIFVLLATITTLYPAWRAVGESDGRHDAVPSLTVRGKLARGFAVDTIAAVPVVRGNLSPPSLAYSKTATIDQKGRFSLTLEKTSDWLLVLMNSSATGAGRFVGLIACPTAESGNTLLLLPVSTATTSRLMLGKITPSGDGGLAEHPLKARKFSMTREQLLRLAKHDDQFMNVKNLLLNYSSDASGIFYILRPDFSWYGNYAETQGALMAPDWYAYRSYNFQLDSNSAEVTMDQVCGAGGAARVSLDLYPPAGSTVESKNPTVSYTDAFPISNNNAMCTATADGFVEARDEDFFATNRYGDISYTFGVNLMTNPIPPGYWRYVVGGVERASFDVSVAFPLTLEGKVNGFAPVLRINTDGVGQIVSIDIAWYVFDSGTNTFQGLTDLSVFQYLIGSANVFLVNQATGTRRYESVTFDPTAQATVQPQHTWYYGETGTPGEQADEIGIFYASAGIGYFFKLTKFVYPTADPSYNLPLPVTVLPLVTKGQQYNSCWNNIRHTGLDFGFTPSGSEPFLYYDVIAPGDGLIMRIATHPIGSNAGVDVEFLYNRGWGTFIAFEPYSPDPQIADLQERELSVFVNQVVKKDEIIGRLVVPQTEFPHIHWQVYTIDINTMTTTDVCPRQLSAPEAQDQLDELYGSSREGIVGRLAGPDGPFQDACLPPPPPECVTPP